MESYTATHPEPVEDLLGWPWKRFEAFYIAHLRRIAVKALEERKMALTIGLWSNEGLNDDKGTRTNALQELDYQFEQAKAVIYSSASELQEISAQNEFSDEDEKNPFLAPAIRATRGIDTPRNDEGTVGQALSSDGYEIDQT